MHRILRLRHLLEPGDDLFQARRLGHGRGLGRDSVATPAHHVGIRHGRALRIPVHIQKGLQQQHQRRDSAPLTGLPGQREHVQFMQR